MLNTKTSEVWDKWQRRIDAHATLRDKAERLLEEAHSAHVSTIIALSDAAYVGKRQGKEATQLWRVLLKTGQRWVRRNAACWQLSERYDEILRLRSEELDARSEENSKRRQEQQREVRALMERCVQAPSYQYKYVVFLYEAYDTSVWREVVHRRSDGDVDRTVCGRDITPKWFNVDDDGARLEVPQLSVSKVSGMGFRRCKVCSKLSEFGSVPANILIARNAPVNVEVRA